MRKGLLLKLTALRFHQKEEFSMAGMSARQIASGVALLISAFCAFVLYSRQFDFQMQLGCVVLVCVFAYLFLSSTSPRSEDTEKSSQ